MLYITEPTNYDPVDNTIVIAIVTTVMIVVVLVVAVTIIIVVVFMRKKVREKDKSPQTGHDDVDNINLQVYTV